MIARALTLTFAGLLALFVAAAPAEASGKSTVQVAFLKASTATKGKAVYVEQPKKGKNVLQVLKVQVEQGQPNKVLPIKVNGAPVGQLKLNAVGYGEVNFKSATDNPGGPTKLPRIKPGDKITVGTLSATFSLKK